MSITATGDRGESSPAARRRLTDADMPCTLTIRPSPRHIGAGGGGGRVRERRARRHGWAAEPGFAERPGLGRRTADGRRGAQEAAAEVARHGLAAEAEVAPSQRRRWGCGFGGGDGFLVGAGQGKRRSPRDAAADRHADNGSDSCPVRVLPAVPPMSRHPGRRIRLLILRRPPSRSPARSVR